MFRWKRTRESTDEEEQTGVLFQDPPELKGVDTDLGTLIGSVITSTNTDDDIIVLNLIQPGTGSWNRIGRRVQMVSVRVKGLVQWICRPLVTTGNMDSNVLRLVLVWDTQPAGAKPTFSTIFGKTEQDGTESTDILDALRYDNMDRFKVLRDTTMYFTPPFFNAAGLSTNRIQVLKDFDMSVPLEHMCLESVYSGQSSPQTIADVNSGGLYFIARATSSATDNNFLQLNRCTARLRFRDN